MPKTSGVRGARKPWDQLPNETNLAYSAFHMYLMAGPTRLVTSIAAAVGNTSPQSWSSDYHWLSRAKAYDEHLRAENERKLAAKREADQFEIEDMRAQIKKLGFKRALEILNRPTSRQTVEREVKDDQGRVITQYITIEPTPDATLGNAVKLALAADRIDRLDRGAPTDIINLDFDPVQEIVNLPDGLKRQILDGGDPIEIIRSWKASQPSDGSETVIDVDSDPEDDDEDGSDD